MTQIEANLSITDPTVRHLINQVPDYQTYGTHEQQLRHFEQVERTARGSSIDVDMQVLGNQPAPDGSYAPLVQTTMTLNRSDGITVYFKGGVHGNELAYRPTQRYASWQALHNPGLFTKLGIDRLVFFDADPVTADMNDWPAVGHSLFTYFKGLRRGTDQADWDYPVNHPRIVHESSVPGCLASQKIIQTVRPRLMLPQHNGDIGSWYMYTSDAVLGMAQGISGFMNRLYDGFPHMYPDIPNPVELAPGVYQAARWEDDFELYAGESESREIVPWGDSSNNYAAHLAAEQGWGPASAVIAEAVYHRALALTDNSPSGLTEMEAIKINKARMQDVAATLEYYLPKVGREADEWGLTKDTDFYAKVIDMQITELELRESPGPNAELSVADLASLTNYNFWSTRPLGMLANLANKRRSLYSKSIDHRLHEESDFLTKRFKPVNEMPRQLVRAQVGAFAISAMAIKQAA